MPLECVELLYPKEQSYDTYGRVVKIVILCCRFHVPSRAMGLLYYRLLSTPYLYSYQFFVSNAWTLT